MAGGKSSRMGTDKSFVPLLGKPLIEHVLERIDGLSDDVIVITNSPERYAYLNLPLFGDIHPDRGPLGGLHTALSQAIHPHVLVVACDMPWLNRLLLNYMLSLRTTADIIAPLWQKRPEPLHAIYGKACLHPVEENLKSGKLKLTSFYGRVKVRFLDPDEISRLDPEGRSFANVNTPGDLAQASKFN
jgi:molybdopterin-guanine dinucleotide biosynthesis protein A